MAAVENKELTHSSNGDGAARAARTNGHKKTALALVKPNADARANAVRALPPSPVESPTVVEEESGARGWRGLLRLAQVARVLGTMSLYLFLNDYDIRAAFNKRVAEKR